jgi:hypothetical protein
MNAKYKKFENIAYLLNLLPGLIAIVYIFGFVILNSHLSNYGLFAHNLIDKTFLSSGILFLLFTGSIITILIYFVKKPTDNIARSFREDLKYLLFILIISISFAYIFIEIDDLPINFQTSFWIALTLITPVALIFRLSPKWIVILGLIAMFFYYLWTVIHSADARPFLIGFLVFSFLSLIFYGHIGDKSFKYVDLVWWSGSIILCAYAFGFYIYGDIKKEFGGGKSGEIQLIFHDRDNDALFQVFKDSSNSGFSKKIKLIYESSDFYYISIDSMYFKLNKSGFKGYKSFELE